MGEIADVVGGGTPKTNDPTNYEGGTIPWVTPADLSGYTAKHIGRGARSITPKGLNKSSARMIPAGSVLFTSRAPVGYVAVASNDVCTNQGFKSFVLKNKDILPDYVYWWLKGNKDLAESYASGTTFLELSGAKAKQLPIPIAPLNQQKLIVAEIEKQFSRLDEAVANLKRVKANLKRYKAAILKAAVEGKLTKEWRNRHPDVEPASELLKRFLAERRAKWKGKGKYKEPTTPDRANLPSLPEGWAWATVEQVSRLVQYGSSAKTLEDPSGVPVLRMGNIVDGKLQFQKLKYLPRSHEEFPELLLESGDLIFNRTNSAELVGKTAVYGDNPKPCSFASYLIRVRLLSGCLPQFLAYYINSVLGRAWIASVVSQQVGQANVNGTKLQALVISLPSLAEQQQIVAKVDQRLSVIERLGEMLASNYLRNERLRQAVLRMAFSGNPSKDLEPVHE